MLENKTAIKFDHDVLGTIVLRPNTVEVSKGDNGTETVVRYFAGKGDGRKSSPAIRIAGNVFDALIGVPFGIGENVVYPERQTSPTPKARGKRADVYRERLGFLVSEMFGESFFVDHDGNETTDPIGGSTVTIDHDGGPVNVELRAIADPKNDGSYLLSIEGRPVRKSTGGAGRKSTEALSDTAQVAGIFG